MFVVFYDLNINILVLKVNKLLFLFFKRIDIDLREYVNKFNVRDIVIRFIMKLWIEWFGCIRGGEIILLWLEDWM